MNDECVVCRHLWRAALRYIRKLHGINKKMSLGRFIYQLHYPCTSSQSNVRSLRAYEVRNFAVVSCSSNCGTLNNSYHCHSRSAK